MAKTMTLPHRTVSEILENNGILYTTEKQIGKYFIDCFLEESSLAIEVMGTYWHSDVRKYANLVNDIQVSLLEKDIKKKNFLKDSGYSVLYLWESDIEKRTDVCEKLIIKFLQSCGTLKNYHSMNYSVIGGKLVLNKEILIPHFEK